MSDQQKFVEEVFVAALELPTEQRYAFIDRACRDAPLLRGAVEEMLAEDKQAGSFLARPLIAHSDGHDLPDTRTNDLSTLISSPPRFAPSQLIAERFAVVRFLARGGMGEVYEVEDRLLQNTHVALKIIRPEIAADIAHSRRFEQEVLLARKLTHPNLCPIYEIFRCDHPAPPFLFLTMKLLQGETLGARLRACTLLPREEAHQVSTDLISGVGAMHSADIIHRDLKPNNVMLERSASRLCVSIMDFGLARLRESEHTLMHTGGIAGTPGYLAPELLRGERPTQATDIFALGVILHQVLTGRRPVEARYGSSLSPSPSLKAADASAPLVQAVGAFLSDDPKERCIAFDRVRSTAPTVLQKPAEPVPLWNRRSFILSTGASVCAVAGGAMWKHEALYDFLHPLPSKRFVALLDWPPSPDARLKPLLSGLIDAMLAELSRAEAFDSNLFVVAQKDATAPSSVSQVNDVRESLGANLVLAASGKTVGKDVHVHLEVLDPLSARTLRSRELRASLEEPFSLPVRAVQAAAELLNVTRFRPNDRRSEIGTTDPQALAAFQAGEALLKQPNNSGLEAAIEQLKQAVDIDQRFAKAYARLSIAYLRLYVQHSDPSAMVLARANAETSVNLEPKSPEGHIALGSVFLDSGTKQQALNEFGIALSLDPTDTRTLTYQAQTLMVMGRWPEAEAAYKRVLLLRPNDWLGYLVLGVNYNLQGRYVDALWAFRASAKSSPDQAMTYNNIAAVQYQLGSFKDALVSINRSISIASSDAALQTRSDIFRSQGRYTEALEAALEAARLNPEEASNWLEVADAYSLLLHHEGDALKAYRKALKAQERHLLIEPEDGPGWMLLALCRVKGGVPSGVPNLIRKAESLGAIDIYSQLYKARVLEIMGQRDTTLTTLGDLARRGITIYQIEANHDLDAVRADPRFSSAVGLPNRSHKS